VLWSAEEVDINGERCWLGSALDITERKQKEQSYALLATAVEQAAESIVITNLQGAILYANPAFEQNTGYTRAEVLGNNPRLLKSGQQDEEFYHHLWSAIGRGETWHGHFINQRKDGTKFEEDATISPVRDAAGNIVNFVAVKRDVTHEMQLEGRIRQTQKMEAIGTLAGGIAHDFNNVLSAIFGYGYLLQQDTEGNAAAQEELAEILKAANRAKDLVQQILTFSRQREQKRQIVRLDSVVKEATKLLRASLPAQIKIEVMLADEAPAVLADPTQIYQVTMNLATNALHAMEGRSGQLTVRLDTFQPEAEFLSVHPEFKRIEYARLTVADTGHGMDAKTMARIFEPFFTTKPVGKGTGLGLAVVHGIVQSHDGLLTVASQIGQGTTFQLYFPAQTSSAELPDAAAGETAIGQGQHILLLDDEPALTASLRRLLEGLNYQVTTSNSAGEAMALFNANPAQFDLVITDMTMPEMNGLEVARQFHTRRPELPVLLASGLAANLTSENLRAAGICELLQKPVAITLLAEALHRTLAKS
jgi:PAS domain S-box-containing protein